MAANTELNIILRDAAKWPLLRMTVPVCPGLRRDDALPALAGAPSLHRFFYPYHSGDGFP
jgi:hypothetical protein